MDYPMVQLCRALLQQECTTALQVARNAVADMADVKKEAEKLRKETALRIRVNPGYMSGRIYSVSVDFDIDALVLSSRYASRDASAWSSEQIAYKIAEVVAVKVRRAITEHAAERMAEL